MAKHVVAADAPWYRITDQPHYLNGVLYKPGDVVQWGEPPTHMMILVEQDEPQETPKAEIKTPAKGHKK